MRQRQKCNKDFNLSIVLDAVLPQPLDVPIARSVAMNPLSHSRIVAVFQAEVQKAIQAVRRLQEELTSQISNDKRRVTNSVLTKLECKVGLPAPFEKSHIGKLSIHQLKQLKQYLPHFSALPDLLSWLNQYASSHRQGCGNSLQRL